MLDNSKIRRLVSKFEWSSYLFYSRDTDKSATEKATSGDSFLLKGLNYSDKYMVNYMFIKKYSLICHLNGRGLTAANKYPVWKWLSNNMGFNMSIAY